jgi:UDP-N-acetylglucosamine 2-epimerase (non-hydrolysing)
MPEEINRCLTDHVASLLFAPTARAVKNLKKEGISNAVVRSGDLMYELIDNYINYIRDNDAVLDSFGVEHKDFLLVTMHRPGNVDSAINMRKIVRAMIRLKQPVFFPVHPRTLRNLENFDLMAGLRRADHIFISQPLSYLDNLSMIYHARAVMTDSGGMQKEALFLGTPCLTLREKTEWVETLKWGNYLVGLSYAKIKTALKQSGNKVRKINFRVNGLKPADIIMQNLSDYL